MGILEVLKFIVLIYIRNTRPGKIIVHVMFYLYAVKTVFYIAVLVLMISVSLQ